ncbi:unnamed protein product [Protopolystoma xenopodis]|uniref:Uncharacterized protein n=1 Tax=Protopolystoma xenopodis TaxID=117903 RepID=A0A448WLL0_9PLAT|nr:unnamed protein product [Protopolystoma xenopodis]
MIDYDFREIYTPLMVFNIVSVLGLIFIAVCFNLADWLGTSHPFREIFKDCPNYDELDYPILVGSTITIKLSRLLELVVSRALETKRTTTSKSKTCAGALGLQAC